MKDGTKTLEQIIREVERARDRAEEKLFEWSCEYVDTLEWYETRRKGVTLKAKYGTENVSRLIEASGVEVYEPDDDAPSGRVKCTARAIKQLRTLEKKCDKWNTQYVMAEDALDALY